MCLIKVGDNGESQPYGKSVNAFQIVILQANFHPNLLTPLISHEVNMNIQLQHLLRSLYLLLFLLLKVTYKTEF